jgi:hypothetical protein
MQNSYCDHRNFHSANQLLGAVYMSRASPTSRDESCFSLTIKDRLNELYTVNGIKLGNLALKCDFGHLSKPKP